jgi:hypothetical protein
MVNLTRLPENLIVDDMKRREDKHAGCRLGLLMTISLATALFAQDELKPGDPVRFIREDVRVVNGIKVDLIQVHNWLQHRKGERPLKHWQQIQVFQIKEKLAGSWDRCVVKTEAGDFTEIWIANLPPEVKKYFERRLELESNITALRSQVEREERLARENNAITPHYMEGPAGYVDRALEQRAEVNLALERVRQKKEALFKLETEFDALRNSGAEITKELAMFTGRRQANLEVWDCGWKRKPR